MTFPRLACLAALPLLLAGTAMAQVFPTRAEGPVTDDAMLIADAGEAALAARLSALRAEGTALEVVTLPNMAFYTMGTDVKDYARLLAENFGLTGTADGKWALMLVFPEDRELRIATGPAFEARDAEVNAIAAEVMAPAFQNNAYDSGITAGVEALVTRVLAPGSTASAETPRDSGGKGLYWLLGGMVVAVGGIVALVKRGNAKFAQQPCAACGKPGLTRKRVTLVEPTLKTEGQGETVITCPACGHEERSPYTIAKARPQGKAQTAETAGKPAPAAPAAVAQPVTKPGMQAHKAAQDKTAAALAEAAETQGGGASARW